MGIDAAIPETSTTPSQAVDAADPGSSINDAVETVGPLPGGLVRRESKRAMPVPLPPKSAQRSRSISHGSGRQPQTVDENGERVVNGSESSPSTPQETSTAVFDGPVPPRKFLRPYPSSPSLSSSAQNGQMMPASPRVPARSNSRNYAKSPRPIPGSPSIPEQPSQGSPYDQQHQQQQQQPQQQQQHQYQYHHQQAPQSPVVPPRSRSASKSLSRSNTLTKTDVKHDELSFMATPSIAEDRETPLSPQEPLLLPPTLEQLQQPQQPQQPQEEQEQASVEPQPQQQELVQPQPVQPQQQPPQQQQDGEAQQQEEETQQQQQPIVASEEALQRGVADSPIGAGAIQKKSSSNSLGHGDEDNEPQAAPSLAPSLLPAHSIPTRQATAQGDNEFHDGRPILRKQKSVDPAAMYRQHQQEAPIRDRLPSRHASERRPNRDRNPSNIGFANPSESGRSREPSGAGETQNEPDRGRKQKSEEGSSKGGMFAWVRSRSKSRDASHAKPNYETVRTGLVVNFIQWCG